MTLYSRGALKPLLIQPNGQFYLSVLINNKISGGTTENFEFQINDDTQVLRSCSAILNGEVFVFGGDYTGPMNQVNLELTSQDLWNNYLSLEVSKIVGCELKRIGDLNYDFYWGACGTYKFPEERVMLCFSYYSKSKCERLVFRINRGFL